MKRTILLALLLIPLCSGCFVKFVTVGTYQQTIKEVPPARYTLPDLNRDANPKTIEPTSEEAQLLEALAKAEENADILRSSIEEYNRQAREHNELINKSLGIKNTK